VTIQTAAQVDSKSVNPSDFLPATTKNVAELWAYVEARCRQIKDPYLQPLMLAVLADPEIAKLLQRIPAAKSMHNAYLGGLLEHIHDLLQLGAFVAEYYSRINGDLLTAGIVFHDLGKITELTAESGIEYSDEGKLLGHNILAMEILDRFTAPIPGFPRELVVQLKHMILSHHGRPEWGSPKIPVTIEAVALHYLDNLDAKIRGFEQFVDKDKNPGNWTARSFGFDNHELYKKA
jgi:3'-5' exoribonuclease